MSLRRSLFVKIGGVRRAYIGTAVYWETELSCQVRRHGFRIRYRPQAWVFHLRSQTGGCGNRAAGFRREYSLYHNTFLFVLRNLSLSNLPLAFMVRLRQALISAYRRHRYYEPLLVGVAPVHAVCSWVASSTRRTALDDTLRRVSAREISSTQHTRWDSADGTRHHEQQPTVRHSRQRCEQPPGDWPL